MVWFPGKYYHFLKFKIKIINNYIACGKYAKFIIKGTKLQNNSAHAEKNLTKFDLIDFWVNFTPTG